MFFKKKTTDISSTGSSDPVSNNPLDGVRVDGESFVFENEGNFDFETEGEAQKATQRLDKIRGIYPQEKFHKHFCKLLSRVGKRKGLKSLEVQEDDEDVRDACAIVYRRLSDSALAPVLDFLSDEAFEDVMVLSFAFGPMAWGVYQEVKEKRKNGVQSVAVSKLEEEGQVNV